MAKRKEDWAVTTVTSNSNKPQIRKAQQEQPKNCGNKTVQPEKNASTKKERNGQKASLEGCTYKR